jgi:hypothetical protein
LSKSTGELQRGLAAAVAECAKKLGLGELQAAVRLGDPRIFEKDCAVCGAALELSCPGCGSLGRKPRAPGRGRLTHGTDLGDIPQGSQVRRPGAYRGAEAGMDIFSVFVITLSGESWEWEGEPGGKVRIFNGFEEDTNDFLLGTFSSEEAAEAGLARYLAGYRLDGDGEDDGSSSMEPVRGATLWRTELDAGQADGEFVRWMRGSEEEIPEYPYG